MGMLNERLKKEHINCIDKILERRNINPKSIKLFGNSYDDYTNKEIDRMTDEEIQQTKSILLKKIASYGV